MTLASPTPRVRSAPKRYSLDELEFLLRKNVAGKTLLGEIVFSEAQCATLTERFRQACASSASAGFARIMREWPMTLAVWLVNEAFFSFQSGAYWPVVLGKVGVSEPGPLSQKIGQSFLGTLQRFHLPEFRKLNTGWSYLGPILAHAGIPRSCLPEFFKKVVPLATEIGVGDEGAFAEFQAELPHCYITKTTERFLLFGDRIAEDFVRRAIDLRRAWIADGIVPEARSVGLPQRVVEAFLDWSRESRVSDGSVTRRCRRPQLCIDPINGVELILPPQDIELGDRELKWLIEPDRSEPEAIAGIRPPGERVTAAERHTLSQPFASLKVRFMADGISLGTWLFAGVTATEPVLFFNADTLSVVSARGIGAGPVGVVHPPTWNVEVLKEGRGIPPGVLDELGPMPLGWGALVARVYDLTGGESLVLRNESAGRIAAHLRFDLADATGTQPRLTGNQLSEWRCSTQELFVGSAPSIELVKPGHQSEEEFLRSWSIEIRTSDRGAGGIKLDSLLGDTLEIHHDGSGRYTLPLAQPRLLGPSAWGMFHLQLKGPLGSNAKFHFSVIPQLRLEHDWSEWTDHPEYATCRLHVPSGTQLNGEELRVVGDAYGVQATGQPINLTLEVRGYAGQHWKIPLQLDVPLPSWAVYEPNSARHLLAWSHGPLRLSQPEGAHPDTTLLLRLATPFGSPDSAALCLEQSGKVIHREPARVDKRGRSRVNLAPLLEKARECRAARLDLYVELRLQRTIRLRCGALLRDWTPAAFACRLADDKAIFSWSESAPVTQRAIEIQPLLTPWDAARIVPIPDEATSPWVVSCTDVLPAMGSYRLRLGLYDEWTARFQPAPDAAFTIDLGGPRQWMSLPFYEEEGAAGFLYREILHHMSPETVPPTVPPDGAAADDLVTNLIQARHTYASTPDLQKLQRLVDNLLHRQPVQALLHALANTPLAFDRRAIIEAEVLSRRWRCGDAPPPDQEIESLWRVWTPLGAWADLQLLAKDRRGAEQRITRFLGGHVLRRLSPVAPDGGISFLWSSDGESFRGRIEAVEADADVDPFSLMRLSGVRRLKLLGTSPREIQGFRFSAQPTLSTSDSDSSECGLQVLPEAMPARRPENLDWHFECEDVALPAIVTAIREGGPPSVRLYQPRNPELLGCPPDTQFIPMLKAGDRQRLEMMAHVCSPLPSSPIGEDAFQQACLAWTLRAAADVSLCAQLEEVCREFALPCESAARAIEDAKPHELARWRCLRELQARWIGNAVEEPLFAVNYLVWLVAMGNVWTSVKRWLPFNMRRADIQTLTLKLLDLTPELLEHDLVKVCAIEALDRAVWEHHEP
ncbi:MAG TPA: hypothetical protein VEB21_07340 [Terriglobales bacterium]|nr:hypothetical protein [Terriglobales bacterium]